MPKEEDEVEGSSGNLVKTVLQSGVTEMESFSAPSAEAINAEFAKATSALGSMVEATDANKQTLNDSAIGRALNNQLAPAAPAAPAPAPTANMLDYMNLPEDLDDVLRCVNLEAEVTRARSYPHFAAFLEHMFNEHGLEYDADTTLVWGDPATDDPEASFKDWLLFLLEKNLAKQATPTAAPTAEPASPTQASATRTEQTQKAAPSPPAEGTVAASQREALQQQGIAATQTAMDTVAEHGETELQHQQPQQTQAPGSEPSKPDATPAEAAASLSSSAIVQTTVPASVSSSHQPQPPAPVVSADHVIDYMNLPNEFDDLFAEENVNIDAELVRARSSPHFATFWESLKKKYGEEYGADPNFVWGSPDCEDPGESLKEWLAFLVESKLAKQVMPTTAPAAKPASPTQQQGTAATQPAMKTSETMTSAETTPAQHGETELQDQQPQQAPGSEPSKPDATPAEAAASLSSLAIVQTTVPASVSSSHQPQPPPSEPKSAGHDGEEPKHKDASNSGSDSDSNSSSSESDSDNTNGNQDGGEQANGATSAAEAPAPTTGAEPEPKPTPKRKAAATKATAKAKTAASSKAKAAAKVKASPKAKPTPKAKPAVAKSKAKATATPANKRSQSKAEEPSTRSQPCRSSKRPRALPGTPSITEALNAKAKKARCSQSLAGMPTGYPFMCCSHAMK